METAATLDVSDATRLCGAAVSANPDMSIRVRPASNILAEMHQLMT